MQAIIDACKQGNLDIDIKAVISNRPDAGGLEHATRAGIHTETVNHQHYATRELFDQALMQSVDHYQPALVILAGFMRILSDDFVNHYLGRMLNIHPSLLPDYPGLNTHQRALDKGDDMHGASVHFVTPELDGGPVVIQVRVPIQANDDAASLAARVLEQEHKLYCEAIQWFAQGRLQLKNNRVWLDNKVLTQPRILEN